MVGRLNGAIDAKQRRLIIGIVIATLLTLAAVIADLAIGGRPIRRCCALPRRCWMALGDSIPAMTHTGRTPTQMTMLGRRST